MLSHCWSVESSVILCEYTCAFFRKLKCGLSSIVSNSFHLLRNLSGERLLQPYTSVDNQGLLVRYFKYDHNYGRSREAKHRELLSSAPPQFWDMNLPDPAREPDSFTYIMLGIDWIDDIEFQVFCIDYLAELKTFRAELTQL